MKVKAVNSSVIALSAAVCLSMAGATAHANGHSLLLDGGEEALISTIDSFHVKVSEQVADGCLSNTAALKDTMEAELKQNGFQIADRVGSRAKGLLVSAIGYQLTPASLCAVSVTVAIELPLVVPVPYADSTPSGDTTLIVYKYDVRQELLTGPKSDMQKRVEGAMQAAANTVVADISHARSSIFTKFPEIKQEFENQSR
ncbi:hypothetical protein ACLPHM_02660 [Paenalcaligenes sp. Me131]|uniref:hypothetical protein n=1 Tax=Paenalcaligenes sp. Me131 TaxID=3392636 RepID=UPI003D2C4C42